MAEAMMFLPLNRAVVAAWAARPGLRRWAICAGHLDLAAAGQIGRKPSARRSWRGRHIVAKGIHGGRSKKNR
ncbi:hypothetical protein [Streptomyces sp. NRRL S-1813]|uniref:hypothetical protein n=1 Tax=Streptomyces sp. NRRL S-1813 TaxID=1463888 RepID=UPI000AAACC39|nr:hypothetical protein [Streptomyces sp. NRRL S-1813]